MEELGLQHRNLVEAGHSSVPSKCYSIKQSVSSRMSGILYVWLSDKTVLSYNGAWHIGSAQ